MSEEMKLLGCPWCDGHVETTHRKEPKGYWVHCYGCACDGPIEAEEADAIAAWNRRAPVSVEMPDSCRLANHPKAAEYYYKPAMLDALRAAGITVKEKA